MRSSHLASKLIPGVCNAVVSFGDSFDVGLVALDRSLHFVFFVIGEFMCCMTACVRWKAQPLTSVLRSK